MASALVMPQHEGFFLFILEAGSSSTTLQSDHTIKSSLSSDISFLSHGTPEWNSSRELELPPQLRRFSFVDLKTATRNFRPDSILGEGGFGSVFKGWVNEHTTAPAKPNTGLTVAVKTLSQSGLQGHKECMVSIFLFMICIYGCMSVCIYIYIHTYIHTYIVYVFRYV